MTRYILFILLFVACKKAKPEASYDLAKEKYQKDTLYYLSPDSLDNAKVIGKEVVTHGKVVQIKHHQPESGANMYFLNLEKMYPNNPMTVMIFIDNYKGNLQAIHKLDGKNIFVMGKVEKLKEYKENGVELKPSITVSNEKQIKVIE